MAGFMDSVGGLGGITSAAQILLGVGEKIYGGIQRQKAEREFKKHPYEIPGSVSKMLDVVRGVASQRKLPGQEFAEQQIGATTAQGVEAATRVGRSASDALGALEGLYGRQMQQQQNLALAGAQNWQENQMRYANTLERMGAYEDQKWQYNHLYPYMQKMTAAGEMQMAGNQNIGSGVSGLVSLDYANRYGKDNDPYTPPTVNNPYRNQTFRATPPPAPQIQMNPLPTYHGYSYGYGTIINNDGSIQ